MSSGRRRAAQGAGVGSAEGGRRRAMRAAAGAAGAVALGLAAHATAEKVADLVAALPDFPDASTWGFKVYSGFLEVPGPIINYDALRIHYQFHTSRANPAGSPVVAWHQGGPGGSSITVGLYTEMGAFRIGEHQNYIDPWSWNKVANMLYLESPAGSGGAAGYSECIKGDQPVFCSWNDVSQAEAYAHTLKAFFRDFPEFAGNDLYLAGESYFGQFGPNIARYILSHDPFSSSIRLKGILAGNACWGGTQSCVACNGPSQDRVDVDFYFGKGLFSPKLKRQIDAVCEFPALYGPGTGSGEPFDCDAGSATTSAACKALLTQMRNEVGPHNIYNVYDNCPRTQELLRRTGKDMAWLAGFLRAGVHNASGTNAALRDLNGGFDWDCVGDVRAWITRPDVRSALHLVLPMPGASGFSYNCTGPASVTLWPELAKRLRVLVYNGDADACVPYNGNEDWIFGLEEQGLLRETKPWTPWFTSNHVAPAGYITKYQAPGSTTDFAFVTLRLAGHMAPTFQPEASLVMFTDFLAGGARGGPRDSAAVVV